MMLGAEKYRAYGRILRSELIVATGCTEPIAVALAGAKLKEYLAEKPVEVEVYCSGNIIKNVKGVTVPNSGGLRGIETAVLLGIIAGDPGADLQVIQRANDRHRELLREELAKDYVHTFLAENVPPLYILIKGKSQHHQVEVEIVNKHDNVSRIVVDGRVLIDRKSADEDDTGAADKQLLNGKGIIEYAETVDIEEIEEVISRQAAYNSAISWQGLSAEYGACVGKTLMEKNDDVYTRARAHAAAGSDARMSGCPMPVVINCGSGNQGMTVSLPVIEFSREMNVDRERMFRALVLANLMAIHQKKYIGYLSAYCGVSSAAAGAAAGICWLKGGNYQQIMDTVATSICTIGGMVCDGAKSSCAAKIAAALQCSLDSMDLALKGHHFQYGEGLTLADQEQTIKAVGQMAREGMNDTEKEIFSIMLNG